MNNFGLMDLEFLWKNHAVNRGLIKDFHNHRNIKHASYRSLNIKQFPRDAWHGFISVILLILQAICVQISQNSFHVSGGAYIWEGAS